MSDDLEDGVLHIHSGRPCWGCEKLLVNRISMTGEDFLCTDWIPNPIVGRIRKIMDGCIVPREITKGCYIERNK